MLKSPNEEKFVIPPYVFELRDVSAVSYVCSYFSSLYGFIRRFEVYIYRHICLYTAYTNIYLWMPQKLDFAWIWYSDVTWHVQYLSISTSLGISHNNGCPRVLCFWFLSPSFFGIAVEMLRFNFRFMKMMVWRLTIPRSNTMLNLTTQRTRISWHDDATESFRYRSRTRRLRGTVQAMALKIDCEDSGNQCGSHGEVWEGGFCTSRAFNINVCWTLRFSKFSDSPSLDICLGRKMSIQN